MSPATAPVPRPSDTPAEFDGMIGALAVAVIQTSLDGEVIRCNDAYARLFGFATPDALRRAVHDIGPQLYVDPLPWRIDSSSTGFMAIGAAAARRESYKDIVYPIRRNDGSTLMVASSGEPQFDTEGNFLGYRGVGRDVTAAIAARDALALSEARLRDAIDSMAAGLLIWDRDDRLIAFNRRVGEILPHARAALELGVSFGALRTALPHASAESCDAERGQEGTAELRLPDGRIVEVFERRTTEGGFITVYRDVTQIRGTMRRLAESEARFRDFAETTADWFWEQDADLRFTFVSASNEAISGISAEAHIGKRRIDTKKLGVTDAAWAEHIAVLQRREAFKDFRYQRIDPKGRHLSLTISGKPIFSRDGAFLGYRGSGKDLTDLVEAERALEAALARATAAVEQQRRFASTVAHEFRTPLSIIDGAGQRLLRHAEGLQPDELRIRVTKIHNAVRGMTGLIDTMLSSARLDAGHMEIHGTPLDLVAFVEAQIRRFDPVVTGREIRLAADPATLTVSADRDLLEQIVANLLSNAIKYSGESRMIDVSLADAGPDAVLTVRDYGIGIPAAELPQIFTRFFRASTAKGLPGTGIGLNLVHDLVQLHGGKITVESEPGRGTCFRVTLPRSPEANGDPR